MATRKKPAEAEEPPVVMNVNSPIRIRAVAELIGDLRYQAARAEGLMVANQQKLYDKCPDGSGKTYGERLDQFREAEERMRETWADVMPHVEAMLDGGRAEGGSA